MPAISRVDEAHDFSLILILILILILFRLPGLSGNDPQSVVKFLARFMAPSTSSRQTWAQPMDRERLILNFGELSRLFPFTTVVAGV